MANEDDKLHEGDAGTTTTKTVEKTGENEKGAENGKAPQEPNADGRNKDTATGNNPGGEE